MSRPSLAEAAGLLAKGAFVFIGRKEVIDEFGGGRDDVLRSFWGAAYLFPVYLFLVYMLLGNGYDDANDITRFLAHLVYYVVAWIFWPVVMITVASALGHGANWGRYVVVSNWTFMVPFLFLVASLTVFGSTGAPAFAGLQLGVLLWSFLIHGWLLQRFFKASLALAIALLVTEFLLDLIFQEFEHQIILRSML